MKQLWAKSALAGIAVLLYSVLPAPAQSSGNSSGGSSGYPASQQGYGQGQGSGARYGPSYFGQGQGYNNPGQAGPAFASQGQGYYNQPGQPAYYNSGGYNQGGPGQGGNQGGAWGGNQGGPWQGGNLANGNNGQPPDAFHYGRGYNDGYQHGLMNSSRQFAGPLMGHPGAFHFTRIRGELQHTKQVKLPGLEEPMLVGLMMSDEGHRIMVVLGPAKDVQGLKLQPGQHITATGELCMTCNRPVLLAEQVRSQGKTTMIPALQDIQPQREQLQGKLVKVHNVQLPGMREAVVIGLVKTKNGQDAIVNLGSSEQMGDLDLEEGTPVSIHGFGFEIDGKQILFADRIRVKGEVLTLYE